MSKEIQRSIEYYNNRAQATREHIEELESNLIDFNETLELLYKEKLEAELSIGLLQKEVENHLNSPINIQINDLYIGEE